MTLNVRKLFCLSMLAVKFHVHQIKKLYQKFHVSFLIYSKLNLKQNSLKIFM